MLDMYRAEMQVQTWQHDVERWLHQRAHLQEALATQHLQDGRRFPLRSRVLIALGTRLIVWGDRLQGTYPPSSRTNDAVVCSKPRRPRYHGGAL